MKFEKFTVEQYRALDAVEFNDRIDEVTRALETDQETPVEDLMAEVKMIEAEQERRKSVAKLRDFHANQVRSGAGTTVAHTANAVKKAVENKDMFDTEEYTRAFMDYVTRGKAIPAEYRVNQFTQTSDAGAVIPTTIMNRMIEKLETYGDIWPRVTKIDVKGGVEYAVADFKPEAHWVTEAKTSDDQKLTLNQTISFKYFMLEVKIAQSFLTSVTTLEMFQKKFPEVAVKAIVKALETAIIKGTGSGQMQGIITDSRIPAENKIEMAVADMGKWDSWHKKVKAKMKKAYRNGIFVMSQATWDSYIDGMVDANGQPVGRVTYGINGEETYRFMGKEVLTVEPELLPDYDEKNSHHSEVFAMFVNFNEYVVNSNMQLRNVKWDDEDNNLHKLKSQLVVDGKLLDTNGVLLLTTPSV